MLDEVSFISQFSQKTSSSFLKDFMGYFNVWSPKVSPQEEPGNQLLGENEGEVFQNRRGLVSNESFFHQKERKLGQISLHSSFNDLVNEGNDTEVDNIFKGSQPNNKLREFSSPDSEMSIVPDFPPEDSGILADNEVSSEESIAEEELLTTRKRNKFKLFTKVKTLPHTKSLKGLKRDPLNNSETFLSDKPATEKNYAVNKPNNVTNSKINDFSPVKLQLLFREQLDDEKVVPLSNAIFTKTDPLFPISMEVKTNTQVDSKSNSRKSQKTKAFLKNFFNNWYKFKPHSESAELENQVFSPDSHRRRISDVPAISEIEGEEVLDQSSLEERRQRSSSTVASLFNLPNLAPISSSSQPPSIKSTERSPKMRSFFTFNRKNSSHVRFVSPVEG